MITPWSKYMAGPQKVGINTIGVYINQYMVCLCHLLFSPVVLGPWPRAPKLLRSSISSVQAWNFLQKMDRCQAPPSRDIGKQAEILRKSYGWKQATIDSGNIGWKIPMNPIKYYSN